MTLGTMMIPTMGGAATVELAAGASLAAYYRNDAFTPGVGDEVAIGTNLQGDALYSVDQGTPSKRPDKISDYWEYNPADSQVLDATGLATPIFAAGSWGSIIGVAQFDNTSTSCLIDLSLGTATNTGLTMFANGGNLLCRARTNGGGLKTAQVSLDTGLHVFRMTMTLTEIIAAKDAVEGTPVAAVSSGLSNNLDAINLGSLASAGQYLDGRIKALVILNQDTVEQRTGVENALIGMFL